MYFTVTGLYVPRVGATQAADSLTADTHGRRDSSESFMLPKVAAQTKFLSFIIISITRLNLVKYSIVNDTVTT